MNSPAFLYVARWLIQDTFRQALASRIFWVMLTVSGMAILFCLGVGVEGGLDPRRPGDTELYARDGAPLHGAGQADGHLTLLFGLFRADIGRHPEDAVHFLQVLLATWVAGTVGLLMTLVWTAGFLPDFLQPASASVLFAKPVPRWALLIGKYSGVLAFVAFQAIVFFVGTWLALGLKTGVWWNAYLLGIPVLVVHFAVIFSFSALVAVLTRSMVASIFGAILFWLVCFGINYGHFAVLALPDLAPGTQAVGGFTAALSEIGYWLLPKPADLIIMMERALETGKHFQGVSDLPEFRLGIARGHFLPGLSLLTSAAFSVFLLVIASRQLRTAEY